MGTQGIFGLPHPSQINLFWARRMNRDYPGQRVRCLDIYGNETAGTFVGINLGTKSGFWRLGSRIFGAVVIELHDGRDREIPRRTITEFDFIDEEEI